MCVCACDGCVSTHVDRPSSLFSERTNERPGGPHPLPSPGHFFFPFFFFLFAMLMRDELAYISRRRCRRRPSVRPSVSPRHEAGSFLSSLITCRRYSSGLPDRWWSVDIFAAERTCIQKEKGKYGSLCLDAHKFRTLLVLRYMVLLHSTTPQTCTTTCYLLLRRERSVCFKSRMFVFSCSAVLLPETYGIPYLLVYISCPLARRKDDAKLASSILHRYLTLLELEEVAPRTIYVLVTVLEKEQREKKNCSARCIACGARLACFICRQTPKTTETLHYLLRVWPACPARPLACTVLYCRYHGCICLKRRGFNASLHYDGYRGPEKRGIVRHLFY